MIEFKEIFENESKITPFNSKRSFWNHFNSMNLSVYPTRFDAPEGTIIYVFNHVKYLNQFKPIRFTYVPLDSNHVVTYFDDLDEFWKHFNSMGLVGKPTERCSKDKTYFYYKEDPFLN